MFEVDFARGFAYRGHRGFIIRLSRKGLYIKYGFRKIFLTQENTRILDVVI